MRFGAQNEQPAQWLGDGASASSALLLRAGSSVSIEAFRLRAPGRTSCRSFAAPRVAAQRLRAAAAFAAGLATGLPTFSYFLRNRSTRPAVSMIFCCPV